MRKQSKITKGQHVYFTSMDYASYGTVVKTHDREDTTGTPYLAYDVAEDGTDSIYFIAPGMGDEISPA